MIILVTGGTGFGHLDRPRVLLNVAAVSLIDRSIQGRNRRCAIGTDCYQAVFMRLPSRVGRA